MAQLASRGRAAGLTATLGLALAATAALAPPQAAHADTSTDVADPAITITSPEPGQDIYGPTITVAGSYTEAKNLELVIDGQRNIAIPTTGTSGTFSKRIWLPDVDGEVLIAIHGQNTDGATLWSQFQPIELHHPLAAKPTVEITSPGEGVAEAGRTNITVKASAPIPVWQVEVRVNGGHWVAARPARLGSSNFTARVKLSNNRYSSIEARAKTLLGVSATSETTYVHTGSSQAQTAPRVDQDRAVWVWERAAYEAVFNKAARTRMAAVLDDTATFDSDQMTTIYLGVDKFEGKDMLRHSRSRVASFITWAHSHGYTVHATVAGGTTPPYLGAMDEYRQYAVAEFEKVLNYNLAMPQTARFDGVNVDIEPYILGAWPGKDLPNMWLTTLETLMQRRDASGLALLVGPAIPRWLDTSDCCQDVTWHGKTAVLSDHIQDLSDYVSIMDYRDTATGGAGIIPQAQHEIDYANSIGKEKSVVIGIETQDLSDGGDPETVTFWEEGRDYAEAELDKVYDAFSNEPSFAGVAMHHYDSLLIFPSNWEDPTYYPVAGAGPTGPALPKGSH